MHLLELPFELLEQLFQEFVECRSFKRAMRLRIVSRQFANHTNEAIFRARLLDSGSIPFSLKPIASFSKENPWASFVQRYIAHRILRNLDQGCRGGQLLLIAKRYGELTDQSGDAWLRSCVTNLCGMEFLKEGGAFRLIKMRPSIDYDQLSFQSDILDLAVYLDDIPLVKRLLAEDPSLGWSNRTADLDTTLGKHPKTWYYHENFPLQFRLKIATHNGSLEMIKLLMAADPVLTELASLPRNLHSDLFKYSARGTEGHRKILDFALNIQIPKHLERSNHASLAYDRSICFRETPFVGDFNKIATMLGLKGKDWWASEMKEHFQFRLSFSAAQGQAEMVQYCLKQGAEPNSPFKRRTTITGTHYNAVFAPLILAVERGHTEIVRILLDSGADPNRFCPTWNPLMAAVHRGHLAIVKLLLSSSVKINEGFPPPIVLAVRNENTELFHYLRKNGAVLDTAETGPWAMTFAELQESESMIDILVAEGAKRNVDMKWVSSKEERYAYFSRTEKLLYEDYLEYFSRTKDYYIG